MSPPRSARRFQTTTVTTPAKPAASTASSSALPPNRGPHCESNAIAKWGFAHGLRRYRCKACKATFNALTATPLAHLRKRELWASQALVDGVSLRKVADRLDIQLSTAFNWRHRFLEAPQDVKAKRLEGTVEADETYFLYSAKGSRGLTRPARKRAGKAAKRGLSAEQVPVLIARDRDAATTDQVHDDRSALSIGAVLAKDAVHLVPWSEPARTRHFQ